MVLARAATTVSVSTVGTSLSLVVLVLSALAVSVVLLVGTSGASITVRRAAIGASLLLALLLLVVALLTLVGALVTTITVAGSTVRTSLLLGGLLLLGRLLLSGLLDVLSGGSTLLLDGLVVQLVQSDVTGLGLDNLVEALLLGALLLLDVLDQLVDVFGVLGISLVVLLEVVSKLLVGVTLEVTLVVNVLVGGFVEEALTGLERQFKNLLANELLSSGRNGHVVGISDTSLEGSGDSGKREEENGLDLHR